MSIDVVSRLQGLFRTRWFGPIAVALASIVVAALATWVLAEYLVTTSPDVRATWTAAAQIVGAVLLTGVTAAYVYLTFGILRSQERSMKRRVAYDAAREALSLLPEFAHACPDHHFPINPATSPRMDSSLLATENAFHLLISINSCAAQLPEPISREILRVGREVSQALRSVGVLIKAMKLEDAAATAQRPWSWQGVEGFFGIARAALPPDDRPEWDEVINGMKLKRAVAAIPARLQHLVEDVFRLP